MASLTIVQCPSCGLPAEVFRRVRAGRASEQSVTTHCVLGHSISVPLSLLEDDVEPAAFPPLRRLRRWASGGSAGTAAISFAAGAVVASLFLLLPAVGAYLLVGVILALALTIGFNLGQRSSGS